MATVRPPLFPHLAARAVRLFVAPGDVIESTERTLCLLSRVTPCARVTAVSEFTPFSWSQWTYELAHEHAKRTLWQQWHADAALGSWDACHQWLSRGVVPDDDQPLATGRWAQDVLHQFANDRATMPTLSLWESDGTFMATVLRKILGRHAMTRLLWVGPTSAPVCSVIRTLVGRDAHATNVTIVDPNVHRAEAVSAGLGDFDLRLHYYDTALFEAHEAHIVQDPALRHILTKTGHVYEHLTEVKASVPVSQVTKWRSNSPPLIDLWTDTLDATSACALRLGPPFQVAVVSFAPFGCTASSLSTSQVQSDALSSSPALESHCQMALDHIQFGDQDTIPITSVQEPARLFTQPIVGAMKMRASYEDSWNVAESKLMLPTWSVLHVFATLWNTWRLLPSDGTMLLLPPLLESPPPLTAPKAARNGAWIALLIDFVECFLPCAVRAGPVHVLDLHMHVGNVLAQAGGLDTLLVWSKCDQRAPNHPHVVLSMVERREAFADLYPTVCAYMDQHCAHWFV
jgi:hypothetical protein